MALADRLAIFADTNHIIGEEFILRLAMGSAILLAVISIIVLIVAVKEHDKTTDMRKRAVIKWLSIVSWLPAGVIPTLIKFGFKYFLFATVLPVAVIYYFFELSKQEKKESHDTQTGL